MYLLLAIIIIFILICKKYKQIKEPMVGYCLSEKIMPYHIKEVTTNNSYLAPQPKKDSIETSRILKRKIKAIRKALEDKATWEFNKINSYSKYSPTLSNDLQISENVFYLENPKVDSVNPVLTQFDNLKNHEKTYSFYVAPKNFQLFNEYGFKTYY